VYSVPGNSALAQKTKMLRSIASLHVPCRQSIFKHDNSRANISRSLFLPAQTDECITVVRFQFDRPTAISQSRD